VRFDGSPSSDPDGDLLAYAWDLDGDGRYDDSDEMAPSRTYDTPGPKTAHLRVRDAEASDFASVTVLVGENTAPSATIETPLATTTWRVGDVIAFSGSATDPEEGTLPASALQWTLVLHHCPSNCHEHVLQGFPGVSSGSFVAPDHDYPSYLELRLTATDALGATDTKTVALQPKTVRLDFESVPPGLDLTVNGTSAPAPFAVTVIVGSSNSVTAPSPQTRGGSVWVFVSWSDGGAASHEVVAPAADGTYTATFRTPIRRRRRP
jgi:PKD repeat protein